MEKKKKRAKPTTLPSNTTASESFREQLFMFKAWSNYFKYKEGKFYSYAKEPKSVYTVGCWFRCNEEEIERLREAIHNGWIELIDKLPGNTTIYPKVHQQTELEKFIKEEFLKCLK